MSKTPDDPAPETRRMNEDEKPAADTKKKPARGRGSKKPPPPAGSASEPDGAVAAAPSTTSLDAGAGDAVNDDSVEGFDPEATITLSADQLDAQIAESIAVASDRRPAATSDEVAALTAEDDEVGVDSRAETIDISTIDHTEGLSDSLLPDSLPPQHRAPYDDGAEIEDHQALSEEDEEIAREAAATEAGEAAADDSHDIVEVSQNASPNAGEVTREHLKGLLEALIFASDKPLRAIDIARSASAPVKEVRVLLDVLKGEYVKRGIHLDEVAGGWIFRTSATYAPFVRDMATQKPVRLSRAQVETLAILAYRQPITRPEIDDIRGVDCGPVLKLLLERDLVRILGKKDEPGRPILYGTSHQFLEFFGLQSLRDLPTLREFTELNEDSRRTVEHELGEVLETAQGGLGDDPALRGSAASRTPEELAALETDGNDVAPQVADEAGSEASEEVPAKAGESEEASDDDDDDDDDDDEDDDDDDEDEGDEDEDEDEDEEKPE